jgi:transcription termination factor Rho
MYTIDDLDVKLLSELKEIAEGMGVKNARKLAKQELVYKILDQQAITGDLEPVKAGPTGNNPERKMRPRRRENVAPAETIKPEAKELSSDELLQSMDLDVDKSVTRFEERRAGTTNPKSTAYC